jgi:hypothetical protein
MWPLYVNFNILLCEKWRCFQGSICLFSRRFFNVYLTHLEMRIWSLSIHIYFKILLFWPPKLYVSIKREGEKKTSLLILNVMILQTVRNECVRLGGHVDIQVSYYISWLEALKTSQFCTICLTSKRGCFEAVLDSMQPRVFKSWLALEWKHNRKIKSVWKKLGQNEHITNHNSTWNWNYNASIMSYLIFNQVTSLIRGKMHAIISYLKLSRILNNNWCR